MKKPAPDQICDELVSYIEANILDANLSISPDTPFHEAGLDSMSIIELILFIERKYGVFIQEADLTRENLSSVRSLASLIVNC